MEIDVSNKPLRVLGQLIGTWQEWDELDTIIINYMNVEFCAEFLEAFAFVRGTHLPKSVFSISINFDSGDFEIFLTQESKLPVSFGGIFSILLEMRERENIEIIKRFWVEE